jgi:hypothetical protein
MINSRRDPRDRHRFPVTVGRITVFTVNLGLGGFCTELLRVLSAGARRSRARST